MIPPLAITPLITHIPHAVPVVIIWGIMLRFYLVQRKQKIGLDPAVGRHPAIGAAEGTDRDRPVTRKVWAADDAAPVRSASGRYDEVPAAGRTPTGR